MPSSLLGKEAMSALSECLEFLLDLELRSVSPLAIEGVSLLFSEHGMLWYTP